MPQSPFDNLSSVFGFPKSNIQSIQPTFPYQTTPPKNQAPTMLSPQGMGLPPGLGQQPMSGDPTAGLIPKDSDLMMQGLMQMLQQRAAPPPMQAPGAMPPGEDMQGQTGGEPTDPSQTPPPEVTAMQGEDLPPSPTNLPQPGAPREPVPYIPSRGRRVG